MTTLRPSAPPVNPCCEHDHEKGDDCPSHPFFTFGQAVRITAVPLGPNGRDDASPYARRHHGRIGIVVGVDRRERADASLTVLYSIAIYPAIQVRLHACELARYDGASPYVPEARCMHGLPPDIECPRCDLADAQRGEP